MLKILMMIFCLFKHSLSASNLQIQLNNVREKVYNKVDNRLFIKPIKNAEYCNDYKHLQNDIKYKNFFMYNNKYIDHFNSNDCFNHVFKNITDFLNCVKLICYFYDKNENIFVFDFMNVFTIEENNLEIKILFSIVCSYFHNDISFKKRVMSCENCVMLDAFDNILYDNLKIYGKLIEEYESLINSTKDKTKPKDLEFFGNKIFYNCIETIELYDKCGNFLNFVCPSVSIGDNIGYCMISRVDENFLFME